MRKYSGTKITEKTKQGLLTQMILTFWAGDSLPVLRQHPLFPAGSVRSFCWLTDTYTGHHLLSSELSWAWGRHCVPSVEHPLAFSSLEPFRSPLSAEVMAGTRKEQQIQTCKFPVSELFCIHVVRECGAGDGKQGASENWVELYLLADQLIPVYEYKMHTFCYTASRNYCGSDYNLPFEIFISSTPITEGDRFLIISDAARCSSLLKLLRKTHKTYVFHCSLYNPEP